MINDDKLVARTTVKRCFVQKTSDGLSSQHAQEVSQKHGTNVS